MGIDGEPRPEYADCLDLQVSLLTNTAPAHRFASRHRAVLRFAADGLVVDYPFIGRRKP